MTNWKEYKLGEIADVRDGTHDSPKQKPVGKPLVTSKHIKGGRIDLSSTYLISLEDFVKINKRSKVDKWDILFSMIGTIGEMVIVRDNNDFAIKNVGLFKTGDEYLSQWIYYYFKSPNAQKEIVASLKGSTQQYISLTDLRNFPISLPPEKIGRSIIEILSSLDDKIELNNKINQELENLAQTLFKQWFIDFEFPNENGDPYKSSGGEMVESELGEIPKGWEVIKIEDLGEVICGKTPSKKISEYYGNDMPFIKIPDMHNNTYIVNAIDNLSVKGYKSQSNKTLPKNSIVVSSIATVGLVSITSEPSQTNQQINSIIPKEDWLTFYIYDLCKSLNDTFIQLASGGSATLNMNTSTFKNISVLLPNKAVIKEYHLLIVNLFEQIEMNIRENQELTNLRDTLLPKLISGELEVADVMAEKA